MSSRRLLVLVVLALTGLVAGATVADAQSGRLHASLTGKKEVSGGQGNGSFSASFRGSRICYTLTFKGARNPIAAHIHRGRAGQNGPVVVDLAPSFRNRRASKCVAAPANLRRAIRRRPGRYYVNVHTKKFPDGTMRGQLQG